MSDQVVLYDLASAPPCKSWTPNPWKSRILLNFKDIPYKTEWMEYPDLAPKFKEFGIPPNSPGSFADYSSPAVRLPDGSYVMDSMKIAKAIEKVYPEPSCHLETGLQDEVDALAAKIFQPLFPNVINSIVQNVLQEPSKSWCIEDRERRFGMSLQAFQEKMGGEPAWKTAEPGMIELKKMLTERKQDAGPYILGSKVTYGDLMIGALFEGLKRMDLQVYERFMAFDESFAKHHETCKPWCLRDDH
nr:glutathione s-transferase-like protein usts [Quercus suber]